MRRAPLALVVLTLFAFTTSGSAVGQPKSFPVGSGNQSCGEWVESRRKPNDIRAPLFQAWVQGYLAGLSLGIAAGSGKGTFDFIPPDLDAASVWIDNYCKAHPLEKVMKASSMLASEIRSGKKD